MITLTMALLGANPAAAAVMGNPARTVESGFIALDLGLGQSFEPLDVEGDCDEYCTARAWVRGPTGRLTLRPADFFSVWAEGGRAIDIVTGSDHSASGLGYAVGAHFAVPGRNLRPALSGRASWLTTSALDTEGLAVSESRSFQLDVAALLAIGDAAGGANAWFGPAVNAITTHDIALFEYLDEEGNQGLSLSLKPYRPVGVVLGGELISQPLGNVMRARSPRMSAGMEARVWDSWSATAWMGVSY